MAGHSETPLMKQYTAIKAKYPGAILLFRVGDFYETFGEDAVVVSKILGIVLTKRGNGSASEIELAGFPHHSLDSYLPKLVRAGKRVAVCDQLEDPKMAKGIVKRGVTELVTPGITFNDKILEVNKSNYLASLYFSPQNKDIGIAFIEISTSDFFCLSGDIKYVEKILHNFFPSEILVPKKDLKTFHEHFGDKYFVTRQEDWLYQTDYAREKLLGLFKTHSLKGFGVDDEFNGIIAAGAIVHYLDENQQKNLGHISRIYRFNDSEYVWLDPFTVRNLELVHSLHPEGVSLVDIIDFTQTPMGARALRQTLCFPLKNVTQIQERLEIVENFLTHSTIFDKLCEYLKKLGDLERLASKTATQRLIPREAMLLRNSLSLIEPIRSVFQQFNSPVLTQKAQMFSDVSGILEVLTHYLAEETSGSLQDGGIIRRGVSSDLDELRTLQESGKDYLLQLQQREMVRTGIPSLKVHYNKVFGYYLEVTNVHKNRVPPEWIRKQTLTNAERYITEELKIYEEKILNAEEKILRIETELYSEFLQKLQLYVSTIQQNARILGETDVLMSFAIAARKNQYSKPEINDSGIIDIKEGRHPVIETRLPSDSPYIPNDVHLDSENQQVIIITGPNMAGKSALLRQTALIVLMAQMGSFVPASRASIGIVDKIFTRVGASDNLSGGESTFMVEMNETAQIVNNATPKSLILLDEIGRGTSTYDGVSIAWALVEYLHETPDCRAKTLFATHYHELNELEGRLERVKNFHVSVKEHNGKIIFLRKLKAGGSEHSFGIHVAEMAGMPPFLTQRAKQLLEHFEQYKVEDKKTAKSIKFSGKQTIQLNMFELKDADTLKIRQVLAGVDIDRMTPVEALLKLQEIKKALVE
ncbi:MAG: DNA mismatch repair protein MutS [Bacteroidia bacterium]|nr:DNA mismatch repair protein MutS [Bacteroidia bacterium]